MSAIAIYCQKSHDNAVVSNYDAMVQQLSAYCNNDLVTVGPIVINSTISTTSSFEARFRFDIDKYTVRPALKATSI